MDWGAGLMGGAFGKLFDNEIAQLALDGLINGGLKELWIISRLKKGIDLKTIDIRPDNVHIDEYQNEIIENNREILESNGLYPCIGFTGPIDNPRLSEIKIETVL